jgi:hypothetical protein
VWVLSTRKLECMHTSDTCMQIFVKDASMGSKSVTLTVRKWVSGTHFAGLLPQILTIL